MLDDIDEILRGEIRRIKSDDQLFVPGEDYWMNAWLDRYPDLTELYIVGYKEAGDTLVNSVANRGGSADSLIFPIVFLYRHYIELRLKSLLQEGHLLLAREYKPNPEHKLSKLWRKVRRILIEIWPDENENDLEEFDSLVAQFEQVDPRSTTFRYPKDLDGNNSVKIQSPIINLKNIKDVIGSMAIILEGSAAGISEYQGHQNDMRNGLW